MRLIGMLDSPYVRRVAISLHALGVGFEHEPLSVFRTFDAFAAVNPVVKAPTLVTDEGVVLMDSTLILDHVEQVAGASLMPPPGAGARLQALRLLGLALAACEKSVALVYETPQACRAAGRSVGRTGQRPGAGRLRAPGAGRRGRGRLARGRAHAAAGHRHSRGLAIHEATARRNWPIPPAFRRSPPSRNGWSVSRRSWRPRSTEQQGALTSALAPSCTRI